MKRIADWNTGKYLMFSSSLFLLPAVYAWYIFNLIQPSLIFISASLISVNFWRDAVDDWRRYLDLYFAKFVGIYCTYIGITSCPIIYTLFAGFPSLFIIIYLYNKASELYNNSENSKVWIAYHMGFHLLVTIQLFIVIYYMGSNSLVK
uniref:Uncharacterized protein n=1 Tax=viral metagenome TaxID=1070528 RepID=A0A6C0JDT2_9ZZZZ